MMEKTCRCGKTKKNFNIDIGPFFIAECCTEAGYDHLGQKKMELSDLNIDQDQLQTALDQAGSLEIVDEGEQPDPNEEAEQQEQAPPEEVTESQEESQSETDKAEDALEEAAISNETKTEEIENSLIEVVAPLTVNDEGHIVRADEPTQTQQPEKKKRAYNRGGNIKK